MVMVGHMKATQTSAMGMLWSEGLGCSDEGERRETVRAIACIGEDELAWSYSRPSVTYASYAPPPMRALRAVMLVLL